MAVCEATSGARVIGLDMARLSVLAITAVAVIAIPEAQAVDTSSNTAETERVTVAGETTGSLTSGSPEESAKQKTQVPGAFTVKTVDDMELGRASNFEDLLQRTPGVFLQSENGAEVSKISIRGSGITSEDEPLGVMFLLDGVNFNEGMAKPFLRILMLPRSVTRKFFGAPMHLNMVPSRSAGRSILCR
jgi:outer membrane receptor for Fe3+-dicitrate